MKTRTSWHQFVDRPLRVACTIAKIVMQLLNANWWASASDCRQWHQLLLRQTIQGIELRTETEWKKFEIERWCTRHSNTAYDTAVCDNDYRWLTIFNKVAYDTELRRLAMPQTVDTEVVYDTSDDVHQCRKGIFLNFVISSRCNQGFVLLLLHGNSCHNVFGTLLTHRPAKVACSS